MVAEKLTIVLLPGLNGTEGLFNAFIENNPGTFDKFVIGFPTQEHYSYAQLADYVLEKISHLSGGFILLGESFSGPLSLLVAQTKPQNLKGVILVATFISAPNTKTARFLPWKFGFGILKFAAKFSLQRSSVIAAACNELQNVDTAVLAKRIDSVFKVDVESALRSCPVPMMYFRGAKDFLVSEKNLRQIMLIRSDLISRPLKTLF